MDGHVLQTAVKLIDNALVRINRIQRHAARGECDPVMVSASLQAAAGALVTAGETLRSADADAPRPVQATTTRELNP
jgi:hypothetical protein